MSRAEVELMGEDGASGAILSEVVKWALAGHIYGHGVTCEACDGIREAVKASMPRPSSVCQEVLDGLVAAENYLEGWASAEPYLTRIRRSLAKARAQHEATLKLTFAFDALGGGEEACEITVHGTEAALKRLVARIGYWQRMADAHSAWLAQQQPASVIPLTVHAVADAMPDADTDVIIFDADHTEGQLGAYIGDDEEGPIWVAAQGDAVGKVTHWAAMPRLTR